jgi:hypothetical protein
MGARYRVGPTGVPNSAPLSAVAPRPSRGRHGGRGHRSRVHEEAAARVARDPHLLVHVDDAHAAHRRPAIEGPAIPRQHLPHRVDRVPAWLGYGRGMDAQGHGCTGLQSCRTTLGAQHWEHNTLNIGSAPSVHEDAVEERQALDPGAGDHLG